jgi:F-box-like
MEFLKNLCSCLYPEGSTTDQNEITTLNTISENEYPPTKIPEIIFHIFSFLETKELLFTRLVCRQWRQVGNENALWLKHPTVFPYINILKNSPSIKDHYYTDEKSEGLFIDVHFIEKTEEKIFCILFKNGDFCTLDISSSQFLKIHTFEKEVNFIKIVETHALVLENNNLTIIALKSCTIIKSYSLVEYDLGRVSSKDQLELWNDELLICGSKKIIQISLYKTNEIQQIQLIPENAKVLSIDVNEDFLVVKIDQALRIWDLSQRNWHSLSMLCLWSISIKYQGEAALFLSQGSNSYILKIAHLKRCDFEEKFLPHLKWSYDAASKCLHTFYAKEIMGEQRRLVGEILNARTSSKCNRLYFCKDYQTYLRTFNLRTNEVNDEKLFKGLFAPSSIETSSRKVEKFGPFIIVNGPNLDHNISIYESKIRRFHQGKELILKKNLSQYFRSLILTKGIIYGVNRNGGIRTIDYTQNPFLQQK